MKLIMECLNITQPRIEDHLPISKWEFKYNSNEGKSLIKYVYANKNVNLKSQI